MKINILKIALASGLSALSLAAAAQNLDPTVVVNRAYEGKLLEVNKPALEMAVPDTVQQFDLEFDYSVFENPYKGSYDFKPYQLIMKPASSVRDFNTFWLKAGAGYSLYPELGLVWTPAFDGRFKMNVYGDYNAYIGEYRLFRPNAEGVLKRWENTNRTASFWNGYRMKTRAGVDGRVDLKKAVVSFDMAYYGVASKDTLKNRAYDSFDMKVNVASRASGSDYFMYDVTAAYRFGEDKLRYEHSDGYVGENVFRFGATLGQVFAKSHKVLFDVGFDMMAYSGAMKTTVSEIVFAPHYVFGRDRWNLDLGLRLAKVIRPEDNGFYSTRDQIIYPDINVRYALIPDAMSVYGKIGGGNQIHTYSSLLDCNAFVDPSFAGADPLLNLSVERISFAVGLDGRISRRFTYDVHAGFSNMNNGLLAGVAYAGTDGLEPLPGLPAHSYVPVIGYATYNKLYAGLDWIWHTDDISFNGAVEYAHYTGIEDQCLFTPAPFTGDVAFEYNWNRRLFLGLDCRFATARKAEEFSLTLPGFADLGLYAEYATSRKFSVWLRGGNLLNATVQHIPLYAEKGINFTAGICLKL